MWFFNSFAYYTLKIFMNICKYLLFLIVFWLAVLFILSYINPLYIENIFWIGRDKSLYVWWGVFRIIMNFILLIPFILSLIWAIVTIITQGMYLEWRKYILWIIIYGVFWVLLLPYIAVMEQKEIRYRRFRLSFYFYTMIVITNLSWFIWAMVWDLWIIVLGIYRGVMESM